MMKKLLSILLALCLLLTPISVSAVIFVEEPLTVHSSDELYAAIQPVDGVLTIPDDTCVCFDGEIYCDDMLVVGENAEVSVLSGVAMFCGIENRGKIIVDKETALGSSGEGDVFNFGTIEVVEGGALMLELGQLTNSGTIELSGIYVCGILAQNELNPQQEYAFAGEAITASQDAVVLLIPIIDDLPVDYAAAFAFAEQKFAPAQIFALARSFDKLRELNDNEGVTGIYLDAEDFMVPMTEDTVISKRLCISGCDLVLQHGKTLTIEDYENNLKFLNGGRIVCESEGAAGPDCLSGGTLVLNGTAILSGDPGEGAINPTRDIVWVTSGSANLTPRAADVLVIGDSSEADLHGDLSAFASEIRFGVRMDGDRSRARLTGDFTAPSDFFAEGELNMEGYTLTADAVYYYGGTRINEGDGGAIATDNRYYSVEVEGSLSGEHMLIPFKAGDNVIMSVLGFSYEELLQDQSFCGVVFGTPWMIPEEDMEEIKPALTDVGGGVEEYCFTMPNYPLILRGDWAKQRVELTAGDATIAFEGIEGHTYELGLYVDSKTMTDEALAPLGVTTSDVLSMIVQLEGELDGKGTVARLFSFGVTDNGENAFIDRYEYAVPEDEDMQEYAYLMVLPVRVDDQGAHIDGSPIECRREDGVLTAVFRERFDAYIIVGTNTDPCAVTRVEIMLNAPADGTYTDLPGNPDDGWSWNEQWNRPDAHTGEGRGAYLGEAYWTLADDPQTPYIGVIGEGETVGVYFMMLAEPDYYFSEDVEIIVNGATVIGQDMHWRDEDGKADILFIYCTYPPEPEEDEIMQGDADGDGSITVFDATAIQRELVGLHDEHYAPEAADADGDGNITVFDATAIQRWLVGLDQELLIGQMIPRGPAPEPDPEA